MPGSAQEIRYINRDENTHLWLFRNMIRELKQERPELFTDENVKMMKELLMEGVRQEILWGGICDRGSYFRPHSRNDPGLYLLSGKSPLGEPGL